MGKNRCRDGSRNADYTDKTESYPEMETQAAVSKNLHLQRHLYTGGTHAHGHSRWDVQLVMVRLSLHSRSRPCPPRPTWLSPPSSLQIYRRLRNATSRRGFRHGHPRHHWDIHATLHLPNHQRQTRNREKLAHIPVRLPNCLPSCSIFVDRTI